MTRVLAIPACAFARYTLRWPSPVQFDLRIEYTRVSKSLVETVGLQVSDIEDIRPRSQFGERDKVV